MENQEELKANDKVSFCVVGNPADPFGYGVVQYSSKGKILIKPDYDLSVSMVLEKIKKVS